MLVAAFIVTVDIVVWQAIVFSIAGPMLVSGIYEALLDNRILNYLESWVQTNALTIQERAHLLFVVLLGNLDFAPAWDHSFGSSVGAPVVFYIGSFIYAIFEINETWGSYQSAHPLAIGMLWIMIPHVAIVSSLMLAGNNPSVWQGTTPQRSPESSSSASRTSDTTQFGLGEGVKTSITSSRYRALSTSLAILERFRNPYESVYRNSKYKPAWTWNRGPNRPCGLRNMLKNTLLFFGALVSYTTPQIGLGCRSLTMLVYAAAQLLLIILNLCDWCFWKRDSERQSQIFRISELAAQGCGFPMVFHVFDRGLPRCLVFSRRHYLYSDGSLFQLFVQHSGAQIFWNSATIEQIYYAKKWWFPAGIAGTAYLTLITYLGWWYQRSLRIRFHKLAENIDHVQHAKHSGKRQIWFWDW
ncbi:hypothetical protein DL98DRAFT_653147 [Cadophora sp. DSE1049]|nr:hypothetical protein DL98DRAFT_653147 [Cadophora sp. DSE1049]